MIKNIDPNDMIDITIVDAMFLLHVLLNVSAIFGEIARVILSKLCDLSVLVDLVAAKCAKKCPCLCVVLKRQTPELCSIYITFWLPTMVNIFPLEART